MLTLRFFRPVSSLTVALLLTACAVPTTPLRGRVQAAPKALP